MLSKIIKSVNSSFKRVFKQNYQSTNPTQHIQSEYEKQYQNIKQNSYNFIRQEILKEAIQTRIIKKCISNKKSVDETLIYGEEGIWELYTKQDYRSILKTGQILLPYITQELEKTHISIGQISLIMAESYLKQNSFAQALPYLHDAEISFHDNQEELEDEQIMNYYYSLKISQLYSKLSMVDKSFLYSIMSLKTKKLSISQKIIPCYLILNYFICKKDYNEALSFGESFLKQISFNKIIRKCTPEQIEHLGEFYKTMIKIVFEQEKNYQKTFILIDQLLLLLEITNSQDLKLIDNLKNQQKTINQELYQQQDLLFVLGFYAQKLKLENNTESSHLEQLNNVNQQPQKQQQK